MVLIWMLLHDYVISLILAVWFCWLFLVPDNMLVLKIGKLTRIDVFSVFAISCSFGDIWLNASFNLISVLWYLASYHFLLKPFRYLQLTDVLYNARGLCSEDN